MSSPVLHIKDAYFFEVPTFLWTSARKDVEDFPDVWVRLDDHFQGWEANRLAASLGNIAGDAGGASLVSQWKTWQASDHHNFKKPLDVMLDEEVEHLREDYDQAVKAAEKEGENVGTFKEFAAEHPTDHMWFINAVQTPEFDEEWQQFRSDAGNLAAYRKTSPVWGDEKIEAYNHHLSGKILLPQPFGQLRNLHEAETGFCISKFMVIQVVVALVMLAVFGWLAKKMFAGGPPRGRIWNMLEIPLVYVRDSIARPAIGSHDGDRFVPLLWTVFMFILICNLCGLLPWVGAPTGAFGMTTAMAMVVFGTGVVGGMKRFGPLGFFLNQIPSMQLPLVMAIFIKPMLLAIELLGYCIKHGVLAIRLLANIVAGHLVLAGIMGLAFGLTAVTSFSTAPGWQWWLTATISVLASVAFSCLELFVAFLQAFIFTFLSALFIGASIHHH